MGFTYISKRQGHVAIPQGFFHENKTHAKFSKLTVYNKYTVINFNRLCTQHKVHVLCVYSEDWSQSAHQHSLISLSFLSEETLDPWLPIIYRAH